MNQVAATTDRRAGDAHDEAGLRIASPPAFGPLTRTLKLRVYPDAQQTETVARTIDALRHVWNTLWLPLVVTQTQSRRAAAEAAGGGAEAWRAAEQQHPWPSATDLNRVFLKARDHNPQEAWLEGVLTTPITRAARHFCDALQASRGRLRDGRLRHGKLGRVRAKTRRNQTGLALSWQIQGTGTKRGPKGGKTLRAVIDPHRRTVAVPKLGDVLYRDKGKQLAHLFTQAGEVCQMTLKRDGGQFYLCLVIRGLAPVPHAGPPGGAVGLALSDAAPLVASDGSVLLSHQGHDICQRMVALERQKMRLVRVMRRKRRAALAAAGAREEGGQHRVVASGRMRRTAARIGAIERQMIGFRADWQRNAARDIVSRHESVVVGVVDETICELECSSDRAKLPSGRGERAKRALERGVMRRGRAQFVARLRSKAEELGARVIAVDLVPARAHREVVATGSSDGGARGRGRGDAGDTAGRAGRKHPPRPAEKHTFVAVAQLILRRGLSAGASPVAGRGGFAIDVAPSGAAGERADEPSTHSSCAARSTSCGDTSLRGGRPRRGRSDAGASATVIDDSEHPDERPTRSGSRSRTGRSTSLLKMRTRRS